LRRRRIRPSGDVVGSEFDREEQQFFQDERNEKAGKDRLAAPGAANRQGKKGRAGRHRMERLMTGLRLAGGNPFHVGQPPRQVGAVLRVVMFLRQGKENEQRSEGYQENRQGGAGHAAGIVHRKAIPLFVC